MRYILTPRQQVTFTSAGTCATALGSVFTGKKKRTGVPIFKWNFIICVWYPRNCVELSAFKIISGIPHIASYEGKGGDGFKNTIHDQSSIFEHFGYQTVVYFRTNRVPNGRLFLNISGIKWSSIYEHFGHQTVVLL